MARGGRTGIELGAVSLQSSPVVDLDLVPLLGLPITLDGQRHVDLQLIRSEGPDGGGCQEGQRQKKGLHCRGLIRVWLGLTGLL